MASFFQELWESIFTPGPTPSLLIATNVTFACLQVVLAGLLAATRSVHLAVLSVLCAGLWWAINWFARELKVAQRREAEEAAAAAARRAEKEGDSETEVETVVSGAKGPAADGSGSASASKEVEPVEQHGELKQRGVAGGDGALSQGTKSNASTEDEWERVSENENEKDK